MMKGKAETNTTSHGKEVLDHAYALFQQSQVATAEGLFRTLLDDTDVAADAHAALGIVHLQKSEDAEAEKLFRLCNLKWGGTAESMYGLGVIHETLDPGYARAHYEFALLKNPKHAGAKTRLARMAQTPAQNAAVETSAEPIAAQQPQPKPTRKRTRREIKDELFRGIVTNFSQHVEVRGFAYKKQYQVWNFVVERKGDLEPVSVQMSGRSSVGVVREGDEVELPRTPRRGKVMTASRIKNLTRNAVVKVKG